MTAASVRWTQTTAPYVWVRPAVDPTSGPYVWARDTSVMCCACGLALGEGSHWRSGDGRWLHQTCEAPW